MKTIVLELKMHSIIKKVKKPETLEITSQLDITKVTEAIIEDLFTNKACLNEIPVNTLLD